MIGFEVMFLIVLGLVWLVFASIEDIRTKEVADWLNFSLIIFILGFRFFYSLFELESFMFFYQGLVWFGIFFVLAHLFYYSRMFGGGDAKLMYAFGPLIAFSESFSVNWKIAASFILIFFLVGAVYGLIGTVILMFRNFKRFKKQFAKQFKKFNKLALVVMVLALILMGFGFSLMREFFYLGVLLFIMPLLFIFSKAIAEAEMVKSILVGKLREGDLLYADVKVGKSVVKMSWEGLEKDEIEKIRRYHKKVKIREGLAYVPVFLISFLVLIYFFNSELWNSFF